MQGAATQAPNQKGREKKNNLYRENPNVDGGNQASQNSNPFATILLLDYIDRFNAMKTWQTAGVNDNILFIVQQHYAAKGRMEIHLTL